MDELISGIHGGEEDVTELETTLKVIEYFHFLTSFSYSHSKLLACIV